MSKRCFLICPIGEKGSETRRISDIAFKYIVEPACKEFDYEVIRSDTEYTTNSINDDIFSHLDNDELAIADLTGLNPNVFYEAGYRKAKGLPLIQIAQFGTQLPFDIKTIRTYFYGIDVDKAELAREELKKVISGINPSKATAPKMPQRFITAFHEQSNGLTRDAKNMLKALYRSYVLKKSQGLNISEASSFNDIEEICNLSGMNAVDVKMLYNELSAHGYLKYESDDLFEMVISSLTGKGIKYGEDNFDEPTYIILLRKIVKKYSETNAMMSSKGFDGFSQDDFSILKSQGFIEVMKYLRESMFIKPTDKGITEIALRDSE